MTENERLWRKATKLHLWMNAISLVLLALILLTLLVGP